MSSFASSSQSAKRVAVVGAGPAGLAALRELLAFGHDAVAFERRQEIGGVYAAHYKELQLTTSSVNTSFGSFSDGTEHTPRMWRGSEYLDYLKAYAAHFELMPKVRLGTSVESIHWNAARSTWTVAVNRSSKVSTSPAAMAGQEAFEFDHVAICSGVNTMAVKPQISGLNEFAGEVLHSSEISDQNVFAGRNVLVIGLGESGSDIALLAAEVAKSCAISTRKGPGYVIPRYSGGRPTDLDTNRCYHALPRWLASHPLVRFKVRLENLYLNSQDDRAVLRKTREINRSRGMSPFQRFGTKNISFVEAILYRSAAYKPDVARLEKHQAVFVDGSRVDCDLIVYCTGYKPAFPYLDDDLAQRGQQPRSLFKHMICPELGTSIAWLGLVRPGIGSIPPAAELQARYFALLVSSVRSLPSISDMHSDIRRETELDFEQYPDDAPRVGALTDYLRFLEGVAELIGCQPPLKRLFLTEPRLWAKVLFGPLNGAQYRLVGPGADPELAQQVLKRVPTMPWLVLGWEALFLASSKLLHMLGAGERFRPIGI